MSIDPEKVVISVLMENTGLRKEKLQPEARLLHDLGVDGDDAEEVLIEISDKCSMDISSFDFLRYFHPEASLSSFWRLFWLLQPQKYLKQKTPLTVGDLIEAARRGKLT